MSHFGWPEDPFRFFFSIMSLRDHSTLPGDYFGSYFIPSVVELRWVKGMCEGAYGQPSRRF
ncbi:hypothetical protein KY290_026151 [Solanum tuberosum]|uniref:Uncharacterized protein n=1 Tax=Solanum tuberosum TaxID=4113 RepID=A0ABQ7UVM8_SOLTU|nr:hypothetical protein KY289_025245 [Solanum tuberosum]KAH0677222.1 hypothetical protein KY285_025023 [Solanum tuberosum]KAH0755881.1 hypothetical protein KY290_026151 [Solanum tuberosum]